ncbi:carboxypeptidase M32 [bacterium]|nr:carboxypeptidase M32 [bacterium]
MDRTLEETYDGLMADTKEIADLHHVSEILEWDQEVMMPPRGIEARSRQVALIAGVMHQRSTDPRRGNWIAELEARSGELNDEQKAVLREIKRDYEMSTKLPPDLVQEISRTTSIAHNEWIKSRAQKDFSIFAPHLETIVGLKKRVAEIWGYAETPYDALLNAYEPGATTASIGKRLGELREKLVPWVEKIAAAPAPRRDFLTKNFPIEQQKKLARAAMEVIGFNTDGGRLDIAVHPFCTGTGGDVRLTTRYFENEPFASFYGVLHEAGHGLYEQGLREDALGTPLGWSSTMAIHESQSRMWENEIGRSRAFLKFFESRLQEAYPTQLSGVSIDELYAAINHVEPSLIRVEADEVTYGLHIALRFEIERDLLSGDLSVSDLPAAWNKKVEEYLGITPKDDAEGCLQDVHWSIGALGYFPSYALGSLNAAQFFAKLREDVGDVDGKIEAGDFGEILEWLHTNIHRHGRRYLPDELVEHVTGKPPAADDFMTYVAEKFGPIYGISS